MKALLFSLILINTYVFSQCPQSGLKIQSKDCQEPKALSVSNLACTEMKVKWVGTKGQTYLVNATYSNASNDNVINAKVSEVSNDNGNCTASIATTEGVTVKWDVQSVCLINGAKFYSHPVIGAETYIPLCRSEKQSTVIENGFQAYPNPCKGVLVVEYNGKSANTISLNIFDVNGKKVFTQNEKSLSSINNQYKMDLHRLPTGSYILEMVNGAESKQAKFVLIRE